MFFPERCLQCNAVLEDKEHILCRQCIGELPRSAMNQAFQNQAELRFNEGVRIERAASFCWYKPDTAFRDMIHKAKYGDRPEILYRLAQQAVDEWLESGFFDNIDVVVPVPMHKQKMRQRGYNQADYIADAIADMLGIQSCKDALVRVRNDESQTMQLTSMRAINVHGAFELNQSKAEYLKGKMVLLVDDVLTTGSTLTECIAQLRKIRKLRIVVFTLGISIN